MQTRGTIRSLEALDFVAWGNDTEPLLRFLEANTQLSMLSLQQPDWDEYYPAVFLEEELLPLLSHSFWKLTSLSLYWEEPLISESALEIISSLTSLEQIHLSAGKPPMSQPYFPINHNVMRKHLQKIALLKKIAFSNDAYSSGLDGSHDRYYYDKVLPEGEPTVTDRGAREDIWEQSHLARMLEEAHGYGQLMPQLEWLFFGQIQMGFEKNGFLAEVVDTRIPVALTTKRDLGRIWLRKMFGLFDQ